MSGAAPPEATASARSVLREPPFLRLWIGTTASGLATWALPFVLGLGVVDGELGVGALGVVLAARTVGFLVAVPISGVVADRWSRRAVIAASGLVAAVASGGIALGLGWSATFMVVAAAVAGAGQGACRPAFQALTAEVVDPERRQQANAAQTLAVRATTLVAPAGTALLGTVLGVRSLLLVVGALWLVAALLPPAGDPRRPVDATSARALVGEFVDGLREARRHPWFLAGLGALTTVIATGYSATGVALPLVSRERFGSEVVLAGALTGYTLGALLGALLIARWRPRSAGWAALAGLAVYGFAPLALLLPVPIAVVVAAYVVAGVGIELFNVPWFTATQREVEPRLLARVSSLDFLFSYGLAPLGLALIAPAITTFGATPVLGVCAVLCFVAPALAALVPSARHFAVRRSGPATVPDGGAVTMAVDDLTTRSIDEGVDSPAPARRRRVGVLVAALVVALAGSVLVAIGLGAASVSPPDTAAFLWAALTGGPIDADQVSQYAIVWEIRTPRVLLAATVGAGLATVGVVIQALVRNALADPFVLGVSSGASVGAVAVIVTGALAFAGIYAVSLGAFLGALGASAAVYGLSRSRAGTTPLRLVLVGVALAYGFQAAMGLLVYLVPGGEATGTVLFWTLGSFGAATWGALPLVVAAVMVCLVWSWRRARGLDLLALGDETATSAGIEPSVLRRELFVLTAIATGAMVAVSGAIGFIGLVLPHVVRLVVGVAHARVLLVAPLVGGVFAVWVDVLARTIVAPRDLPLGVITALIGVPIFVALIRRRGYVYGAS